MIYVGTVGLLVTAGLGLLSDSLAQLDGARDRLDAAADAAARQQMVAMGWHPPASPALRELDATLQRSHGVELLHVISPFRLELDTATVTAEPAREETLASATVVVADELSLYPRSFLTRSGLRRVAFCENLRENRRVIPSLPNYRHTLLLDAGATGGYLRRLLHHEVFHFADLADDGEVLADPTWARLNPAGFEYGRGGREVRQPTASALTDRLPGFLTYYATSALEEDKAEVFAFLMARPAAVRQRRAADPVLAAKVDRLERLAGDLSPEMNRQFWARIARIRAARR